MNGGKRLRPAFVYFGYKAAGGIEEKVGFAAGLPSELLHAGLLIHDDVMDKSKLRRNKSTIHDKYAQQTGDEHFGVSTAITMSDALISGLAYMPIYELPVIAEDKAKFLSLFIKTIQEVAVGQQLDLETTEMQFFLREDIARARARALQILDLKSGRYTIEKPLLMGATLAGASEEMLVAFSQYGRNLGIAFQLQDDILGMFGTAEKVGKPVDSDLKEGKVTILVIETLERLRQTGRSTDEEQFFSILGNADLTIENYWWVRNLMEEVGARGAIYDLAANYIKTAQAAISNLNLEPEPQIFLLGIAEYMLQRES